MTAPNDVAALVERLAIRAARFEANPGNDLVYGRGEAQTDKDAADLIATQAATIAALQAEVERAKEAGEEPADNDYSPFFAIDWTVEDYLGWFRSRFWMVAVHNDYRLNGQANTFWLLTHPTGRWVKGEGPTDRIALYAALKAAHEPFRDEDEVRSASRKENTP